MTIQNEDKNKVAAPAPNSQEPNAPADKRPVGATPSDDDAEFENELKALNGTIVTPPARQERSEVDKATFSFKSQAKRLKELGVDPSTLIEDGAPAAPEPQVPPAVDTSNFVTKIDLAKTEASKLAKSPGELSVIMWWVTNKGMTVEDAHYMANKGKIQKKIGEVNRANSAVPSNGGGAGQAAAHVTDAPEISEADKKRLAASGMIYDPAKKAYVGKKMQYRFDDKTKVWVTERI